MRNIIPGYRHNRMPVSLFLYILFGFLLFTGNPALSQEEISHKNLENNASYVNMLVKNALEQKLYDKRYWHVLLHYKKSLFGYKSLIDDPNFFLAKKGKTDPKAELEATIRAFFDASISEDKNAVCRFMGRFTWLKKELQIDESKLPYKVCNKYKKTMELIKPSSMALIFPASYISNPASMYGHTFLLLEREGKNRLLAFSINYQAHATESRGPLYAFKGLFGLYNGFYDVLPYYDKVEEYSDMDKREMWEYPLKFNKDDIERLMLHLFELDNIYSNYFYLDENCSYNLLFLLEAANPSLDLTDQFGPFITPVDTLKVVRKSGIIGEPEFRPSRTTKIQHLVSITESKYHKLVLNIINEKEQPDSILKLDIPNDEKIKICDLLSEFIQFTYSERDMTKEKYSRLLISTLKIRSSLGKPSVKIDDIKKPDKPEIAHDPNRIAFTYTLRKIGNENKSIIELAYRPTYHILIDADEGYDEGAQIVFGNFVGRYYIDDKKFRLQQIDVIDVMSLVPRNRLIRPLSWKMKTGLMQKFGKQKHKHIIKGDNKKEYLFYNFNPGLGMSWKIPVLGLWYVLGEVDCDIGPARNYWFNGGVGASTGFVNRIAKHFKIYYSVSSFYYGITEKNFYLEANLRNNIIITRNTSIIAEYTYRKTYKNNFHEFSVKGSVYFY